MQHVSHYKLVYLNTIHFKVFPILTTYSFVRIWAFRRDHHSLQKQVPLQHHYALKKQGEDKNRISHSICSSILPQTAIFSVLMLIQSHFCETLGSFSLLQPSFLCSTWIIRQISTFLKALVSSVLCCVLHACSQTIPKPTAANCQKAGHCTEIRCVLWSSTRLLS